MRLGLDPEPASAIARRAPYVVMSVALAVAGLAVARRLESIRPLVEGVDFYYYVCVARDLADGVATSLTRHFYFPGVYRFWRLVFAVFGRSLPSLQTAYVLLLVANGAAVAAVVWRGVGRAGPALLAGLWYLTLCPEFEAFGGITEPLATPLVLLGLAAWRGEPLRGKRGLARALALGAGLGLGVYAKQQAGLLALGAASLPLLGLAAPGDRRHQWVYLAVIPAAAVLTLMLGILAEGDGLAPLRIGLSAVSGYASTGTPWSNLRSVASHAPLLALATLGLLAAFAGLALLPRWRPLLGERWAALAGFALLAGLAGLTQFGRRHYLHYALLPAPLLIVAVVLAATAFVRRLPARGSGWPEAVFVVAALAGLLRIHRTEIDAPRIWRTQPEIAADLVALEHELRPGEDLLIIPPRRNEIHFLFGTRSRSYAPGYSWAPGPGQLEDAIHKPELDAVLVFRDLFDKTDGAVWRELDCSHAVASLGLAGFRPVAKLGTSTLFRRVPASPDAPAG